MSNKELILLLCGLLLVANIPLYKWLFGKLFSDKEDFKECLYYNFRLGILSWAEGELLYSLKQGMRIQLYFGLCVLAVFIEAFGLYSVLSTMMENGT